MVFWPSNIVVARIWLVNRLSRLWNREGQLAFFCFLSFFLICSLGWGGRIAYFHFIARSNGKGPQVFLSSYKFLTNQGSSSLLAKRITLLRVVVGNSQKSGSCPDGGTTFN